MRLHPGEVEAGGWHAVPLTEVVERLRTASPDVAGRPRVVAIDGRGGAGKTMIIDRLREVVPASAVVHTDDIAWHQSCFDWGALIIEHVLKPLHRGKAVDFVPPAWVTHDRQGAITVPAGLEFVWVEGTGIIRDECAAWIDASLYLQGDLDVQDRRLGIRDGTSPEQVQHIERWMIEELPFLLRERPWERATVVIDGTSELDHDRRTEIVIASPGTATSRYPRPLTRGRATS